MKKEGWSRRNECPRLILHGGGEDVSPAGNGDHQPCRAAVVAQGFAQKKNVLGKIALLDEGIGPNCPKEFIAGYKRLRVGGEVGKEIEGSGVEGNRLSFPRERAGSEVDFEFAKSEESAQWQRLSNR